MTSKDRKECKTCYNCAYRDKVPGSAHSRCRFNFIKAGVPVPEGKEHGIRNGWWIFPLNYDPVWMIGDCSGFSETGDKEMMSESSSLLDIFSILGRRL